MLLLAIFEIIAQYSKKITKLSIHIGLFFGFMAGFKMDIGIRFDLINDWEYIILQVSITKSPIKFPIRNLWLQFTDMNIALRLSLHQFTGLGTISMHNMNIWTYLPEPGLGIEFGFIFP